MNEIAQYGMVALALLGGIALVLHAAASLARATHHDKLADELEAANHVIDCFVSVGRKHEAGESFAQAVIEETQTPEGEIVARAVLARIQGSAAGPSDSEGKASPPKLPGLAIVFALSLAFSGCTSQQLASDEAAVHGVLVELYRALDWSAANPDSVALALDKAAQAAPGDATLKKVLARARAAVQAGDLETAKSIVSFGAALTEPVGISSGTR